jgi:hypothetical protein
MPADRAMPSDGLLGAPPWWTAPRSASGGWPSDPSRQGQEMAGFHCAKTPAGLASATQAWRS